MMKLRRLGIGVVVVGSGILAGAVLFSARVAPAFAAQGEQAVARPTALLQVEPPGAASTEGPRSLTVDAISRDLNTQMELLRSRGLLNRLVAVQKVADLPSVKRQKDAAGWLAQNLVIEILKDTSLLRVALSANAVATPQEQAQLINAIVEHFIGEKRDEQAESLAIRQEYIQEEFKKRSRQLQDARNQLDSRRQQIDAAPTDRIPKQSLAVYSLELRRKQLDLALEKAATATLIERRKDKAGANQAGSDERARLEDRLAALQAQEKLLREETESIDKALGKLDAGETESLERLRDKIHRDMIANEKLEERIQELGLESTRQQPRFRLIDRATAP